jgi:hypothetical protein
MPKSATSMLPRLAAEFFVIVIGVLVALGVDSWTTDRAERVLEREYLQRLLDDVHYDLGEFAFLDSIGQIGFEASVTLTAPQAVADLAPSLLVATVAAAANERQPDLSRSTYRELLSSGRIDLIQAPDVRIALAAYDRRILETESIWVNNSPNLRVWAWSRIPSAVWDRFVDACTVDAGDAGDAAFRVRKVCEFDLGGWSTRSLRQDVQGAEAQQRLLLAGHRFKIGLATTEQLAMLAAELVAALERSLSDT